MTPRHVVIGTAGHVDHGKTTLVKALTGTDTDRFPEEKARGITIDIGFAALTLPDGTEASVVDVPGHEDFVRNMVAGATGVDVALLVVAADEGVMPQTTEHLAILDMLGVRAGVVALTKADLAEDDWLELVRSDVESRIAATGATWEPPVAVSANSGRGLDELRAALARSASRAAARSADDFFRLPVDRVFSLAGAGTVVTGTSWSGTISVGDQVSVLPQGETGRVRSVEVHGARRERAEPGCRTALALAGLERGEVARGSMVVSDPSWRATSTIDAEVTLLASAPRRLTQRSRVRVHLGTAEVMARVTPADGDISPGSTGIARLRLDEPVVARWGDRAVIRSYSPVTTIGGAVIVDPWPTARPRRPPADPRRSGLNVPQRILSFVEAAGAEGITVGDIPVRAGVRAGELTLVVADLVRSKVLVRVGERLVGVKTVAEGQQAILDALGAHHRRSPLDPGMPLELVRQTDGIGVIADHLIELLSSAGKIVVGGGTARLATHRAALDLNQEAVGQKLVEVLKAAGFEGRTVSELEPLAPGQAKRLVEFMVRQGTAVRVGVDRYYHQPALEELVRKTLGAIQSGGGGKPAQLRDALGLTRKYLIPILEWIEGQGWTSRTGDGRSLTAAGKRYLSGAGSSPTSA